MKHARWWLLLALAAAACGSKDTEGKAEGTSANTDPIGVPECDRYMEVAKACMSKASAAQKLTLQQSIDSNRELWVRAYTAGGPARDSLTHTCKASLFALEKNPVCQ